MKKKVCITMQNQADVDVSNLLEMALSALNYPHERIIHYTFLVEEALACWRQEFPEDSPLTLIRVDSAHTVRFEFSLPGEKVDPLSVKKENASIWHMMDLLRSGVGSELKYRHYNGTNRLILVLPKDHVESRIFCYNVTMLTIPLTLQVMSSTIASNIDTLMLGFQDSAVMSGVSLASAFVMLPTVLLQSVVFGASTVLAQYWGKRDRQGVQQIESLSLMLALGIALVFALLAFFFPVQIMGLYSQNAEIIAAGSTYLRWISPSFLLMAVYLLLFCFMQCTGSVKKALVYSVTGCVCNVIFNGVLIFGLFGIPPLGERGAALATVLSAAVQAVLAARTFREDASLHLRFSLRCTINCKPFLLCTGAISAQRFSWNLANNFVTAAIGHMSPDIISANSVLLILSGFVLSMKSGFGKGVGLQMGTYLGKNQLETAKKRASDALRFGTKAALICVPVFVLIGCLLRYLPLKLTDGASQYLIMMIAIYSVNIFFSFMNGLLNQGFLYAGGDSKAILLIDTLVMWGIMVPVSLVSVYTALLPTVIALVILEWNEVFSFPLKFWRVRTYKWLKNLT